MTMTPTNKLRFVGREIETSRYDKYVLTVKVKILQQWWEWEEDPDWGGEWRDVPLAEEA
jgi:hypothetical protein